MCFDRSNAAKACPKQALADLGILRERRMALKGSGSQSEHHWRITIIVVIIVNGNSS